MSGEQPVRFLFISGKPLNKPVAWYDPIVMNTQPEPGIAHDSWQKPKLPESVQDIFGNRSCVLVRDDSRIEPDHPGYRIAHDFDNILRRGDVILSQVGSAKSSFWIGHIAAIGMAVEAELPEQFLARLYLFLFCRCWLRYGCRSGFCLPRFFFRTATLETDGNKSNGTCTDCCFFEHVTSFMSRQKFS